MKKLFTTLLAMGCAISFGFGVLDADEALAKSPKSKAPSASKEEAPKGIAASLGSLKWGMSLDEAKASIADKIMDDFQRKSNGNNDLSYVDNLRRTHTDRIESMQKSQMLLTRENSAALSVSIVGEEFMPDAGESLLTSREDNAMRYYFFKDDKLYKMAIVYDSAYLGPIAFDTFVATTEQKYGKSKNEEWDDDGNFLMATWSDSKVHLDVKNKYASYSTVLMVFSDYAVEKSLHESHKQYAVSLNQGPEVSSAIDALTSDDGAGEQSSIDAMLGRTTKVDLMAGLSQEDIDIINGVTTEKEIEKKKKAKAKKAAKDRKNDAKAKKGLEIF